ncbi:UvrD-helicase domain-containing protein [Mobilicoccus massiliensis]|uniref:UvrD-helicase domain-containing protein n=1 Tax=Mobilicoccus massiliensis TaxID=1522310 RepID=UPI000B0FFF2A|nr:UvrD-helicase domain-containing protein [Mobilicoccus massiliensis]
MTPVMGTFDITAPLPEGTVLLEASAGTGKTWTIGALVTRFVAEGRAELDEMLVVTFGRAASQELRARVREHLVEAARALADPAGVEDPDPVVRLLLDADEAELANRRTRIIDALATFDSATIATTHQFCQTVLRSLGVAGDTERDAQLVDDVSDLLREVVDDLYLRGFARDEATPIFSLAEARAIAHDVMLDPQARIVPADAPAGSPAARRVGFARKVREEMAVRMRRGGLLGYDDLLSRLADALDAPESPAAERMRQRWSVVLVDEFQDTDPVQWAVLDRAFRKHATLVLIGDPKQAIYAFRGGDIVTYLDAARTATTRQTLGRNFRTDGTLLAPLQVALRGAQLGEEGIVVHDVDAAHPGPRLRGAPSSDPFRVRVLDRATLNWRAERLPSVGKIRPIVADDVASEIAALLAAKPTFDDPKRPLRPMCPADVAVLAHTSRQLQYVREALQSRGIPAVLAGTGSVLETPAAADWLTVLLAMDAPHRTGLVRAAALTDLLGYSAAALDAGGDALTDELAGRLRRYAELFAARGLAAVMAMIDAEGLSARMLSRLGGERELTDLRHLAEILHTEAHDDRLGLVALITRLTDLRDDARRTGTSTRRRRLDSDAEAVQLVTIHGSKGLQYDVCFVPYLWDRWVPDEPERPTFHLPPDENGHRARAIDVGGKRGDRKAVLAAHAQEEAGESLRLAYVALTRARAQVVAWWAPTVNTCRSPLHRLLLGRTAGEAEVLDVVPIASDAEIVSHLRGWQEAGGPVIEPARHADVVEAEPASGIGALGVREFTRQIDLAWRRTSYSSLTREAGVHALGAVVTSEPETLGTDDESPLPVEEPAPLAGDLPSPMAGLPVGARFGSLVHAVLEEADPQAADLRTEFLDRIEELRVAWPVDLDADVLADALVAVCDSPLGPLAGVTLRDIARGDRLCEAEFELPLAGGDEPGGDALAEVRLGQIAALLRAHLPEDDPIRPYADELDRPELGGQLLRGYLTGSLDLILRVGERYLVADYKTNWLGPFDEPLTAASYVPESLDAAMGHSDYPLQALLYAVVLHRYLRWRLPGYDPATHLGGVLYLYVRGMCGPRTPLVDGRPCGVFSWQPPPALIEKISALLDGGVA